jgi:hypothetical protein
MSDTDVINDALTYINRDSYKELDKAYISQGALDSWNRENSPYTLKRGEVVTKTVLNSTPSLNGLSYGYNSSTHPIKNIYMFKDNTPIATFKIENGIFVKETSGGSNKKTKKTKSKRRTKRSKKSKRGSKKTTRKNSRKYKMK